MEEETCNSVLAALENLRFRDKFLCQQIIRLRYDEGGLRKKLFWGVGLRGPSAVRVNNEAVYSARSRGRPRC
jgi:hypothetical protein